MQWLMEIWRRLGALVGRRALERRLDEEFAFHVDQQIEKLRRAGVSSEEARRQALVRFGGIASTTERMGDEVRLALLEDSVRDFRHAVRLLARAPGFAVAALLTLAVGIGATSAIFSVVRTVMLEPLPYREPDRIVAVWETNRGGTTRNVIAPSNFVAWRERSRTLDHLGMVGPAFAVSSTVIDGQPVPISGLAVSFDVFNALGVPPALGRAYTADEDIGRNDRVVVLSHEFWQGRLGGRQDVLGLTLTTDGRPRGVIGVMPAGFTVVGARFDVLVPYGQTLDELRATPGRGASYAVGRLRNGVSYDQALAEMKAIFANLTTEQPRLNTARTVMLLPLQEQLVGDLRPTLFALMGAVGLVLLVACVNVANLLLARSAARAREVGMRAALGAKRGRLVRQMLIESLTLAMAGGVAGLGVAVLCHRGLLALVSDRIPVPRLEQTTLDLPVIAFTLITALVTGVVFGVVPAFVSTNRGSDALRDGGRHGGGHRLHRVLNMLVVGEVALSLVLLTGAGLLMRSLITLRNADLGFNAEGVLTARMQLPGTRFDARKADVAFRDSLARLAALPGVEAAAGGQCLPLPGSCIGTSFWRADRPRPANDRMPSCQLRSITPAYFKTLAIRQMAGRDFSASDAAEAAPAAIVSESVVREYFPNEDPIGRQVVISIDHVSGKSDLAWTIVGVVSDVKSSLDGPFRQTIYVPFAQRPTGGMSFIVRTRLDDPMRLANSTTAILQPLAREAPIRVGTLDDVVGGTIARQRALSILVVAFAAVALALAAIGVYGVMAYSVRERTQEIGVRRALGATTASVFRLVIGQALRLVAIGVCAGLVAAGLLTRLIERLLFGIEPLDPWTFTATALVLFAVAAIASYVPARRGTQIAPIDALRTK
jgi:putative ABC transport system permease protein